MKTKISFFTLLFLITLSAWAKNSQSNSSVQTKAKINASLLELPKLSVCSQDELISYCGFNVSYNKNWLIPNWVAYELTKEETKGTLSRKKRQFKPDPNIKQCAINADYSHSGYSRGHMAPAGDMKWDKCAMNSCFYLTNICPQDREMNAGSWQVLEDKCRAWVQGKDESILIVCGPIVKKANNKIGRNGVVVPDGFFKAILQKRGNRYAGAGFLFPNKELRQPLGYFAVSIDDVERITGLDLFHNLPDDVEEAVEKTFHYEDWGISQPNKNILSDFFE